VVDAVLPQPGEVIVQRRHAAGLEGDMEVEPGLLLEVLGTDRIRRVEERDEVAILEAEEQVHVLQPGVRAGDLREVQGDRQRQTQHPFVERARLHRVAAAKGHVVEIAQGGRWIGFDGHAHTRVGLQPRARLRPRQAAVDVSLWGPTVAESVRAGKRRNPREHRKFKRPLLADRPQGKPDSAA